MFWFKPRSQPIRSLCLSLISILLSWGLISCSDRLEASQPLVERTPEPVITNKLAEVPPPTVIQELRQTLDQYQPQVTIVSPESDRVFSDPNITVKLDVKDYPLFKDSDLGLGPHLHLILDNEPYRAIYSIDQPIVLDNLTPGTHTLRVFASRPWHESFKNDGAYAQSTFHVLTKTEDNKTDLSLPLLTYSRPKGTYGAQPIMLDFYLTNAPLHLVAQESPDDQVVDWRIKATINGESFLIDTWQPIYLNGFEEGTNWVKLEFLDEQGNPIDNGFNTTVRLITYEPNGQDTLSKIVRGEFTAQIARSIVDPNYNAQLLPTSQVEEIPQEKIEEPSLEEVEPSFEEPLVTSEETVTEETEPPTEEILIPLEEVVSNTKATETNSEESVAVPEPLSLLEEEITENQAESVPGEAIDSQSFSSSIPPESSDILDEGTTNPPLKPETNAKDEVIDYSTPTEESLESAPKPTDAKDEVIDYSTPTEENLESASKPTDTFSETSSSNTSVLDKNPQWGEIFSNALKQVKNKIFQALESLKDLGNS